MDAQVILGLLGFAGTVLGLWFKDRKDKREADAKAIESQRAVDEARPDLAFQRLAKLNETLQAQYEQAIEDLSALQGRYRMAIEDLDKQTTEVRDLKRAKEDSLVEIERLKQEVARMNVELKQLKAEQ